MFSAKHALEQSSSVWLWTHLPRRKKKSILYLVPQTTLGIHSEWIHSETFSPSANPVFQSQNTLTS